jgi:ribonuclease E
MHDPKYRKSWDAMLDDLGLSGESSAPVEPVSPAEPEPTTAAAVEAEPSVGRSRRKRVAAADEAATEAPPPNEAPERRGPSAKEPTRGRRRRTKKVVEEEATEMVVEVSPEVVEAEAAESTDHLLAPLPVEEGSAEAVPAETDEESEPRRRRRRRRRKGADEETLTNEEEEKEGAADDEVVSVEPAQALEEEDEEFEDLTDLNVPTWGELVAGLYRPSDR